MTIRFISPALGGMRRAHQAMQTIGSSSRIKKLVTLLDLCVSFLRRGHTNLLCIVPILSDDPRKVSDLLSNLFIIRFIQLPIPEAVTCENHYNRRQHILDLWQTWVFTPPHWLHRPNRFCCSRVGWKRIQFTKRTGQSAFGLPPSLCT